jgi:hypothetical protein
MMTCGLSSARQVVLAMSVSPLCVVGPCVGSGQPTMASGAASGSGASGSGASGVTTLLR